MCWRRNRRVYLLVVLLAAAAGLDEDEGGTVSDLRLVQRFGARVSGANSGRQVLEIRLGLPVATICVLTGTRGRRTACRSTRRRR